jgi:hypothetical protein
MCGFLRFRVMAQLEAHLRQVYQETASLASEAESTHQKNRYCSCTDKAKFPSDSHAGCDGTDESCLCGFLRFRVMAQLEAHLRQVYQETASLASEAVSASFHPTAMLVAMAPMRVVSAMM